MRLLKITALSIVILVPLAWAILLLLLGSFSETMGSISRSFIAPIVVGGTALYFIVKGIIEVLGQKKYSHNISIGIILIFIAFGWLSFIMQHMWD